MSAQTPTILFFLSLTIVMQSCLSFKKAPVLPEEPVFKDEWVEDNDLDIELVSFDEQDTIPLVIIMASIEKTHCYGTCPEFKVDFYSDRTVVYRGFYDVKKIGDFSSKLDEKTFERIIKFAERIDFYKLKEYYPAWGEIIDELPVTITSMDLVYKQNRVTNAHHSPPRLHKFERYLLEVIDYLEWEKMTPLGTEKK